MPVINGDQDWLNFVRSARAKSKIKTWFTKERRDEAIERLLGLIRDAAVRPKFRVKTRPSLSAMTPPQAWGCGSTGYASS